MTAADHALPEFLITYLIEREASRADAVTAVLATLTDRERALTKDAAVMGYVRGMTHPKDEPIPKDSQILAGVIEACMALPDLYPAVNAEFEDHRQTVEYFVQCQQPDGTWEQCSSTTIDPEFAVERLAACRRAHPGFEYRITRRTTTVLVEAQQSEAAEGVQS